MGENLRSKKILLIELAQSLGRELQMKINRKGCRYVNVCVCVCVVCVLRKKEEKNAKREKNEKKKEQKKRRKTVCVCVCVVCLLRKKLGSKKWERIEDRKSR